LNEIDYFTIAEYPSIDKIKQSIEFHEDDLFMDEDFTDDMFVNYEYETGENLEKQA
jgi:hypothetical protein